MNLVGLMINLTFSHNFEKCLNKIKLEASMLILYFLGIVKNCERIIN